MFRKIFYTTAGTLTMTAVCYPKTTAEYSHLAIDDTRRYLTIAYNFVYGGKKKGVTTSSKQEFMIYNL